MIGERLREMRLARGLTLAELSELMGGVVTKQALAKYESDKAFPRPKTLVALAQALKVKAADLMREPDYAITCIAYRTRVPLAPRARERLEATVRANLERRLRLEDRITAGQRVDLPKRTLVHDLEEAEDAARGLRERWGLGTDVISSMTEVLERNSVHVFEYPGHQDFDGLAAEARTEEGELRAIGIAENPDTDGDRQRFNLAHELAHVAIHAEGDLSEELAAHRFAGAFLVPRELVFDEVGRRRSDVSWEELLLLKRRWRVAITCILHRLLDLEVIGKSQYEWWRREIRAMGYATTEPGRIEREVSTWEPRHVARAEAEGLLSREQAAAYLSAEPRSRSGAGELDRRELMKLPLEDRRALMRAHADRLMEEYEKAARSDWMEADLGEP